MVRGSACAFGSCRTQPVLSRSGVSPVHVVDDKQQDWLLLRLVPGLSSPGKQPEISYAIFTRQSPA